MGIVAPLQLALTALALLSSILLGGGQGGVGDTFVQMLSLCLFAVLVLAGRLREDGFSRRSSPGWLACLVLVVPLLQLLPLPHYLPMEPINAERMLWSLIPACVIYLSIITMEPRFQRWMAWLVMVLALASLVLGLMQLAGGPESTLRLYENTNSTQAVGFFANRNHLAALFLMCLPLSLACAALIIADGDANTPLFPLRIIVGLAVAGMAILAIAVTKSRSGLVLGMLGLLLSLPMWLSLQRRRGRKRVTLILAAIAVLFTLQFAFVGVLQRLATDSGGDDRWHFSRVTLEAASESPVTGTGLGTFRHVFQIHDTAAPGRAIVNHAHDDYLELWLEARWLFLAVAVIFIGLVIRKAVEAWRCPDKRHSLWAKAASIAVALMLLHSALDFPLRTTSNQAVFALALGILFSWRAPKTDKGIPPHDPRSFTG